MELTELIKDFAVTKLLSKVELDFLEAELWETIQHIKDITSLSIAPESVCKDLKLKSGSSWMMCCAVTLDNARPEKISRSEKFSKLIKANFDNTKEKGANGPIDFF